MNMKKLLTTITLLSLLHGCSVIPTYASISSIPMHIEGVGDVYRYEGRANFPHQMKIADEMLVEHCDNLSGGTPNIVSIEKIDLGLIPIGGGSTTTFDANANTIGNQTGISGTARTTSTEPAMLRNFNQEIHFHCVRADS